MRIGKRRGAFCRSVETAKPLTTTRALTCRSIRKPLHTLLPWGQPGDDLRQDVGKIGEWLDHSVELASSDQIYGMPAECRSNQPIVPGRPLRCTWPRVVTRHRASAPARAAAKPRRGAHRHHGRTSSSDALLRVRGCSGHVHGSRLRKAVRRDPWSELVLVRSRSSCTVDRESQYECEDQFPCFEPRALGAAGSGTTDAAAVAG